VPFFLRRPDVERLKARGNLMGLVRATRYDDPEIAGQARAALEEQTETLIQRLDSKNMSVLQQAREALKAIGPPARDRLIFILGEGHVHRRQDAAYMLGRMKDPVAVEPLCAALKHPDPLLRKIAADALGEIGDARATTPLRRIAAVEENASVAKAARKALDKIEKTQG
jgi:HEAT repeat protein